MRSVRSRAAAISASRRAAEARFSDASCQVGVRVCV